jgi:glutamyl-tRNA reductase
MTLLAFGLNHITAPVEVREKVAFGSESMSAALQDLTQRGGAKEAAILSTCNRTEIYCDTGSSVIQGPIEWFTDYHGFKTMDLKQFIYAHPDERAVKHMLRVASGLDSMVMGEPQVLGQLKDAYRTAVRAGSIGQLLSRLFQHAFRVAKQVRSDTEIGAHPVSIAFAAVRLAQQIFGDLTQRTALCIGAGNTIELAARHLRDNGLRRMIVANRTLERSQKLAAEFNAYAITLGDIPMHLDEADIIVSATASQLPILGKGAIESAVKKRRHRPIFIVDLAVPRDIEPEAGNLEDVYLYTVDDLKAVIDENVENRRQAALQAEAIIDIQVFQFMEWLKSLDAVATIRALRDHATEIQREALASARLKLKKGDDPEAVLQEVVHTLTNKLLHTPSTRLRNAGALGRAELLQTARELFNLTSADDLDRKDR